MTSNLQQMYKNELLLLGFAFASLVLEQESDQQWLREKFMSMEDILEESWLFQEIAQKGEAKGIAKGLEEGSLRELRNMLIKFTTLRFPDLVNQAQKQAEQTQSQEQLRAMIGKLFIATTDQQARDALMS